MDRKHDRRSTDDADAWFYDLGLMAKRVEANQKQAEANQKQVEANLRFARRNLIKIYVLGAFLFFAFMLLAFRSEVNADRIDRSQMKISDTQGASCRGGLVILTKFNAYQDEQIRIERANPFIDDVIRNQRIAAYERARILPLPDCPEPRVIKR